MLGRHKSEVLVVGAGPVGLTVALLLAERDIDVRIVDAEWRAAGHSYALALHPQTLALLDEVGLASELLEGALRVETVALYDERERRAELQLSRLPARFPFLAVLPQSALERALERRLRQKKIKVQWNHRVSALQSAGDRVVAAIDKLGKESAGYAAAKSEWVVERTLRAEARLVVGADGHRSQVRRVMGASLQRVGPRDVFGVFECSSAPILAEMRVVLDKNGASALWPLSDGYRWSLQLPEVEGISADERFKSRLSTIISERYAHRLTAAQMQQLLRERAPWFEVPGELRWSIEAPFERRLTTAYGQGRLWLAGDAAHLTGPLGMQSMNVGVREAHELAWRFTRILRGRGSFDLLLDYERQQLAEWRQLLGLEHGLAATADVDPWVAQHSARILPCLPASGDHLARLAQQIGLELPPLSRTT